MNNPYPRMLQRFRNLPGPYGVLEVQAKNANYVALSLTQEYVELSRQDAQELVRVLQKWLAAPVVETQVVQTRGADSEVVIVDEGPGLPAVVVVDRKPAPHFERMPLSYEEAPERLRPSPDDGPRVATVRKV